MTPKTMGDLTERLERQAAQNDQRANNRANTRPARAIFATQAQDIRLAIEALASKDRELASERESSAAKDRRIGELRAVVERAYWKIDRDDTVSEATASELLDLFRSALKDVQEQVSRNPGELPPGVSCDPDIMGGEPCFTGTRIPLRSVMSFHKAGYSPAQIAMEYPTLGVDQILSALKDG